MEQKDSNHDYQACIKILNSLHSNVKFITTKLEPETDERKDQIIRHLHRIGISLERLDELSAIHVAGTKGKGTTCAFSEKILRDHGYKTGFYSSPHLIEVRERIRINGKPIEKEKFCRYFWKVYNALNDTKTHDEDMPFYFRFLTILSFFIFLEEKVDVAVVEVGVGGEYDCTNILRNVPVVGIATLDIDHTNLLGDTMEKIAWNKAGIMKEGCTAFTVPQPEDGMKILKERSLEKKCKLEVVTENFKFPSNMSYPPDILNLNAGLAVALCKTWLSTEGKNDGTKAFSNEIVGRAILNTFWPGRFQIIKNEKSISYYMDCAHIPESMGVCVSWFKNMTQDSQRKKAFMFNSVGGRDVKKLLQQLQDCDFAAALFVTSFANAVKVDNDSDDNKYFGSFGTLDELKKNCQAHKEIWMQLEDGNLRKTKICEVLPTVTDGIEFLKSQEGEYDLLVTGSPHLVGSMLSVIDPHLNDNI